LGLLLALGGGGLIVVILIIVLTTSGGGTAEAPPSYQEYNTTIDTSFGAGAPGFAIGDPNAPVTVVDYSDFSCSFCAELAPSIDQAIEEYVADGQVRFIYKPMTFLGPQSVEAGKAAYCAAEQGYFWEMHDQIWDIYATSSPSGYTQRNLTTHAEVISGLNMTQWQSCYSDPATVEALQAVDQEATQLGVTGTPTVFLNGEVLRFRSDPGPEMLNAIEAALN
jgi:protein-disulfide isomerase